jgi:hypothetical protein
VGDERERKAELANSQLGALNLSELQLSRLRDWEIAELLVAAGFSRLTADRMVAIERGEAEPGRARPHGMARR